MKTNQMSKSISFLLIILCIAAGNVAAKESDNEKQTAVKHIGRMKPFYRSIRARPFAAYSAMP